MLHKSRERPFDSASDFVPERGGARNEPELKQPSSTSSLEVARWHGGTATSESPYVILRTTIGLVEVRSMSSCSEPKQSPVSSK